MVKSAATIGQKSWLRLRDTGATYYSCLSSIYALKHNRPPQFNDNTSPVGTHNLSLLDLHSTYNLLTMSARFGIRAFRAQMPARQVNTNMRFAQRRTYQSAAENPSNIEAPKAGKLVQLWNSPVGPKTVHFWAPIMKVCRDMSLPELRRKRKGKRRTMRTSGQSNRKSRKIAGMIWING